MIGFDENTLELMLGYLEEDGLKKEDFREVFENCLKFDIEFMTKNGIIADGDFTDEFYDDDDAFDFIIEKLDDGKKDGNFLTEAVEKYFDCHDRALEELELITWE